jgi:hypothetical protein
MIPKRLLAGPLLAIALTACGVQVAHADPLTLLTPAELQYLGQLHRVFVASHDPIAFHSDGELLDRGQYVCSLRDHGLIGAPATLETPAINQLALIYLCPS